MKQKKSKRAKSGKSAFSDRAGFIVNLFREMPDKRFTLKYLAAASGGEQTEMVATLQNIFLIRCLNRVLLRTRGVENTI